MVFNPKEKQDVGGFGGNMPATIWRDAMAPILTAQAAVPFPPADQGLLNGGRPAPPPRPAPAPRRRPRPKLPRPRLPRPRRPAPRAAETAAPGGGGGNGGDGGGGGGGGGG